MERRGGRLMTEKNRLGGGGRVGLYEVIHRIYEGPRAGRWVLQQA